MGAIAQRRRQRPAAEDERGEHGRRDEQATERSQMVLRARKDADEECSDDTK